MLNLIVIGMFSMIFANPINYNLDLISVIEYQNDNNNYGVSDVWGYTDQTGIEYAIVGYLDGTSIVDVSSDNSPIEIMSIPGPSNGDYYYHRDYKTYQGYLYIVNEMYGGDVGMQVVDLNPLPFSDPVVLDTYSEVAQSHNLWIDPSGYAFIEHYSGDNVHIANITNPMEPTFEASFGNMAANCHDVYTKDGIAYISEGWSNRFGIYDIDNMDNIIELASISVPGGYAHNAWLSDEGTHLVTTEETVDRTIKIWNIEDLNNIFLEGEYIGENLLAHNVHIKDDRVYISHYSVGIKIIDIFNPSDPIEIAAYDTYPQGNGSGYVGCWGAFPFTDNNYVYASDMQNGLYIFDFDNIYAGWVEGEIYSSIDVPASNASIKSILNEKEFFTDNDGQFYFGFPEGLHDFEVSYNGDILDTISINFLPHEISNQIFLLDQIQGDVNGDNQLNILDVIVIVNHVIGAIELSEMQQNIGDVNGDADINIQDIIILVSIIIAGN